MFTVGACEGKHFEVIKITMGGKIIKYEAIFETSTLRYSCFPTTNLLREDFFSKRCCNLYFGIQKKYSRNKVLVSSRQFYPQIINGKLRPGDGECPMVHEPRIPADIPVKPV